MPSKPLHRYRWWKVPKKPWPLVVFLEKKVILMSCSTGGTLSIYLAAKFPDQVHAQILYSPNIAIADPTAKMLTGPWGEAMLSSIVGEYRVITENVGTPIEQY